MTGRLTERQVTWLRGLELSKGWVAMSATELGDPEVSTLQSLSLVKITANGGCYRWLITEAGTDAALAHIKSQD